MSFLNKLFPSLFLSLLASATSGCDSAHGSPESQNADTLKSVEAEDVRPERIKPALSEPLTLAFVGDIMMGTTFPDSINGSHLPKNGGKNLFDDCRDIFERADVVAGNLEGSFLNGPGKRRRMTNPNTYYIFRMPTSYVDNLVDAGFDFVGIANNHINDFGEPGRSSTIKTLHNAGIGVAGLKNRCETAYIDRDGRRIGFTQFGHSGNNLQTVDTKDITRVVGTLRDSADIVVVSFHGGAEGATLTHVPFKTERHLGENRGDVVKFAHAAIDAGADVVFGHGPHVPRGVELYKGHIIFYSLGNFCTPYRVNIAGVSGYAPVAEVTIDSDGKFRSGKIHSFVQQRGRGPVADPNNSVAKLMRRLSAEDFPRSPLDIGSDGTITIKK